MKDLFLSSYSMYTAIRHGDLSKLIMAVDSRGNRCGHDSEVIHQPKLLHFDIEKCFKVSLLLEGCSSSSMCVEECPETSFLYGNCTQENFGNLKKGMICSENITNVETCAELNRLVETEKCARYYFESISSEFLDLKNIFL